MFLIGGVGIAITRDPFIPGLFYTMIAGAIGILIYSSMKNRKERKELRRQRKKYKK